MLLLVEKMVHEKLITASLLYFFKPRKAGNDSKKSTFCFTWWVFSGIK